MKPGEQGADGGESASRDIHMNAVAASCSTKLLTMQGCFDSAIERYEYGGTYRGVFPVKCNHDRELLAAVLHAGKPFGFGLEARGHAALPCPAAAELDGPLSSINPRCGEPPHTRHIVDCAGASNTPIALHGLAPLPAEMCHLNRLTALSVF